MRTWCIAFFLAALGQSRGAPAFLEKADLFHAGENGVALFRIPGIVVTTRGTVLVYCEARKNNSSDWADSETCLRRSSDGGRTWDAARSIAHSGARLPRGAVALAQHPGGAHDQTVNNPIMVVDQATGAVNFIYCVNYERCFYRRSDDDGLTFSAPVDITAAMDQFRPEYDCHVIATGPGHGIQLSSGRLLIPVWISTGVKGHSPSVAGTIFSDDHGENWQRGAIALTGLDEWPSPNENTVAQLSDGRVMMNARSNARRNRRVVATSGGGVTNWSQAHFDDTLLEPICMGSLLRYGKNRLLFSNPDNLKNAKGDERPGVHRDRKNVSIKLSYDDGKTWSVNKSLDPGRSGYSDLAVLPDGTIFCFYERPQVLTLARFNLAWLTGGLDSGPP